MGSHLPFFTERRFRRELIEATARHLAGEGADPEAICSQVVGAALYRHYTELRRWNVRTSLVGPGTAAEIVSRHYGESLAAWPLIDPGDRSLVDVGSGAGFPGLVLAAACSRLEITLVESRERKWLFLKTAARRAGLSCRCLNARVGRRLPADLPGDIDLVTCRALATPPEFFELFSDHAPQLRFLVWSGKDRPELPTRCRIRREIRLAGSRRRRILEICFAG